MKPKGFIGFLTVLFISLALVGTAHAGAKYVLKFANPVSKDHSWGKAAEVFKNYVAEATKGQVEVEVYHAGALGKIRETLEMAKMGTVAFVLCGAAHVSGYVPEMSILVLPYLWKDTQTMFNALDGPLGQYINELLRAKGFELMGWWDNGFRHVSNRFRPIVKPEDIKGLKIRCLPTKVHVAFFKALGASPTPMGWTELYPALQQGVVDGQENPPAMVYFGRLYEVQKYYSLTKHINEPGNVLMSRKVLEGLPKELQLAVKVAAQKATLWQRERNKRDNEEFMKKLQEAGMKINEVPEETIAHFRKIAQDIYPEAIKDFGKMGKEMVDLLIFFNK
jgi:tripartite ATP-independent transporter DctP family solute receptor